MRFLLLFCLSIPFATALESQVVDKPVRYVERDMITLQDVQERMILQLRAKKQKLPSNRKVLEELHLQALEDLTEETLILQEADRLGFTITNSLVYDDVAKQLEEAQQVPDPRTLADMVKTRIRSIKIQTVIKHYLDMAPSIRPADIEAHYHKHIEDYRRPARWDVYQILMIPTEASQIKQIFEELLVVYRGIQDSDNEVVKALITEERTKAFMALEFGGMEQIAYLQNLCASLKALEIAEPGPITRRLLEHAERWSTAAAAIQSEQAIQEKLNALRKQLSEITDNKKRLEIFKQAANEMSMGLGAGKGGSLGFVELKSQSPEMQKALEPLKANELSDVFKAGTGYILVYVDNFEPMLQRSFNEVNGEIRKRLERRQNAAIKLDLIKQLREASTIQDF